MIKICFQYEIAYRRNANSLSSYHKRDLVIILAIVRYRNVLQPIGFVNHKGARYRMVFQDLPMDGLNCSWPYTAEHILNFD